MSATTVHSGLCGCRDQLTGAEAAGAAPWPVSSLHRGLQGPGCCCANTGTLGLGGSLGIVVSWTSENGRRSVSQFEDTWVVSMSGVLALP